MNYAEVEAFLFSSLPMFQRIGAAAYKADLTTTLAFCAHLNQPQHKFPSIHLAGTNGKGSVSHTLASVFMSAGYKTGLFTSPHLISYTERIKINGQEIEQEAVVEFVLQNKAFIEEQKPSFFEMTAAMAARFAQKLGSLARRRACTRNAKSLIACHSSALTAR
jgi:dihydrofolate synthase/folylpolyglutamate synthase